MSYSATALPGDEFTDQLDGLVADGTVSEFREDTPPRRGQGRCGPVVVRYYTLSLRGLSQHGRGS